MRIKKVTAIFLCLFTIVVFTARNGNAASGVAGGGLSPETTQPPSGNNSLSGRWLCEYDPSLIRVIFFDNDGTFISVALEKSPQAVGSIAVFKGNYQLNEESIVASNLYWFFNDLSGWRDVPFNKIDGNALFEKEQEIKRIIRTGTRAEVETLVNPDNPYYHQPSNQGWKGGPSESMSGDIKFSDQNNMRNNLIGSGFNEYKRVN